MEKKTINWGYLIWGLLTVLILSIYARNKWMAHQLQGEWCYSAVEVNDGKLIPLSSIELELALTSNGEYLIDQQKKSDYQFKQRFGRLYLRLYQKNSKEGPPFTAEYRVRKHGEGYILTSNEMVIAGKKVATGIQLKK